MPKGRLGCRFSSKMASRALFSIAGTLVSAAVIAACSDPAGAANGAATDLLLVAGDNQAAIIHDTLPVPLRVRATNRLGIGVPGVQVVWAAAGGGQVFPSPAVTDTQGEAVATWTLGPTVGAQTATASVTGLNGSPRTFTATASPAANTLTWTSEQLPGTWSGIWASSPSDVFAVGGLGTIRHFNGSSWELQNSGTTNDLYVVWGISSSDVFAAGSGGTVGTVLHYDGTSWSPVAGTPSNNIRGIWAASPTDVFAAGFSIWHYDGSVWTKQMDSPCLVAVWGSSARDVFAVGGATAHYDGTTWSSGSCSVQMVLFGVWGSGPTDVYSVGHQEGSVRTNIPGKAVIDHYDGTSWQRHLALADHPGFRGVWGATSGDVVAVGENGLIVHYDGTRWRREASGTTESIVAVSGTSPLDVWAITRFGLVLHGTR